MSDPHSTAPRLSEFAATGLTCEHCVSSVVEEVSEIPGVSAVAVALAVGGESDITVASDGPLDVDAVRAAVEAAGYTLVR